MRSVFLAGTFLICLLSHAYAHEKKTKGPQGPQGPQGSQRARLRLGAAKLQGKSGAG